MHIDLYDIIFGSAFVGYVVGGILVFLGVAALVGLVVRDDGGKPPIDAPTPPPARRSPFTIPPGGERDTTSTRRNAAASHECGRPPWLS